ncbi:HNH endonuclease [Bradyrhizobium sp. LLZ17]|uniref:HNH endonuclease n=1 Tax=Bradyrhizobium sp. LLZ17 TaxID=3239388 RepID=A0AB39XB80_9BRAD
MAMIVENPPSFIVRTEAQKAAWDNGYRLERGIDNGWLHYASTTAPGSIWIGGVSEAGPWLLSLGHSGIAAEVGVLPVSAASGPGRATFLLNSLTELHVALDRVYKLAVSLPEAPLDRFRAKTATLPRTTEAERIVIQRIGQDIFRDALLDYWSGRCPMSGITERALLRASHIKPWADCTDAERLDVHNGLLLSALWDAAFDRGLVSFADDGSVLASPQLGEKEREALGLARALPLQGLREAHRVNLALHRNLYRF